MGQEYQRIASQLANLQQQIFLNELPSVLLTIQSQSNTQQYVKLLINGLINLQRSEFITGIAKNITNIKLQNNKMGIENQQLRNALKNQSAQAAKVEEIIKELNKEKICLQAELSDLRARQNSLAQIINSNSIEFKIKEILKENQTLKSSLEQKDKLIEVKTLEIKAYIDKQIFYTSQIRALQNDNNLFHRDLCAAGNEITNLKQQNAKLVDNQAKLRNNLEQVSKSLKKQMQQLKVQLYRERQSKRSEEGLKIQSMKQLQKVQQQNSKEMKQIKSLQQQIKNLQDQLQSAKIKEEEMIIRGRQYKDQIFELNRDMKRIQLDHQLTIQRMKQEDERKQQSYKYQIQKLSQELTQIEDKCTHIIDEMAKLKEQSSKQKQLYEQEYEKRREIYEAQCNLQIKIVNEEKQNKDKQIKEYQESIAKLNQQLEEIKEQLLIQKQCKQEYLAQMDENNHLRAEIQQLMTRLYQKNTTKTYQKKYMFQLLQLSQQVIRIKKQNIQLKSLVNSTLETNRRWVLKQINKLVKYLMECKVECQSCQHWEKYELNKKNVGENKIKSGGQVKSNKDLKALNEKYKLIKEQNEKLGSRIHQIIHN